MIDLRVDWRLKAEFLYISGSEFIFWMNFNFFLLFCEVETEMVEIIFGKWKPLWLVFRIW